MNTYILYSIISLTVIAFLFATIIYFVEQKFKVIEDPKIDVIQDLLPGANCGGCGYSGCRALAEAFVKNGNTESLFCPVGGNSITKSIASVLGVEATEKKQQIAVLRCNGSYTNAPKKVTYDGINSCVFANSLFAGESACQFGCLGCGDCFRACLFESIIMDSISGLPIINENKCTSCGACVKACPRNIIELRDKGPKNKRIFVSCVNKEKGVLAKINCNVACIGCSKCQKICPHEAISIENFLAYIDFEKCKLCRKCVTECPTNAILEINFPLHKIKTSNTVDLINA